LKAKAVWGCHCDNYEGKEQACPRCGKPCEPLGFKVGDAYYSPLRTYPRDCREKLTDDCENGHPRDLYGYVDSRGRLACHQCDRIGNRECRKRRSSVTAEPSEPAGQTA